MDRQPTIAFLVKIYPKLSETFILEEILGLERLGLRLHLFALNRPTDSQLHDGFQRVKAPLSYLASPALLNLPQFILAHLLLVIGSPVGYLKALRFALCRRETGGLADFLRAGLLAQAMAKLGIRHLHAHFASLPAGIAELVNKITGTSFSISAHAKDIYLQQPEVLQRKLAAARFTVTCSGYNCDHLAKLTPQAVVHRLYHGVDLRRFTGEAERSRASPPLLLAVGRLREKKGYATLIDACHTLRLSGVDFRCEIVGYGEERMRLQQQIDGLDLRQRVTLVGALTHEKLVSRYRQATLFVMPCVIARDGDRDGIPNVLLEAMAMELPVVSTAVSGIPEVVDHEHNGLLIPPQDSRALAKAIERLIADAGLRMRLGKAARRTVAAAFCNDQNLQLLRDLLMDQIRMDTPKTKAMAATRLHYVERN